MPSLLSSLEHWRAFKTLVVGDLMLDQLVYGDADRLTADAPVPILRVQRTEQNPGGAANVCMDLIAMHGQVSLLGIVGVDAEGDALLAQLEATGISTAGVVRDPTRPTTVKKNLIGLAQHRHPQKMFRLDYESTASPPPQVIEELLVRLELALPGTDAVAIEDYGKGVCCEQLCRGVIERCRQTGTPVFVDPAQGAEYSMYRGATAITPNRSEAESATGIRCDHAGNPQHNAALTSALLEMTNAEVIVLTLDRHGALLHERTASPEVIPTQARQVYDVTGAGDMVLAALMAARSNGIAWRDAVRFANAAAGLEVEIFGVQAIPFERIRQAALVQSNQLVGKRRSRDELAIEVAAARREGKSIVFTNGCFDIIHAGHIKLLKESARHGDLLIVAINSDDSIRRLKGPQRPVHTERDRVEILSEMASVDLVTVFDEDTPEPILEIVRPDVIAKGADYTREGVVGGAFVESYGGRVQLIDVLEGRSTSHALEKLDTP